MIIGISGKNQNDNDTVGRIIQYLTSKQPYQVSIKEFITNEHWLVNSQNANFQIKKFADKVKDIICLLIGCRRKQLEDETFLDAELGKEWDKWKVIYRTFDRLSHNPYGEWVTEFYSSFEDAERSTEGNIELDEDSKSIELIKLTPRLLLQLLDTECGRNIIHPNVWCNSLFIDYKKTRNISDLEEDFQIMVKGKSSLIIQYPNWIITDCKFLNELKAIKDRNGIIIRVNTLIPNCKCGGTQILVSDNIITCKKCKEAYKQNNLETALDNAKFDYEVENTNDILHLINQIKEILIKRNII